MGEKKRFLQEPPAEARLVDLLRHVRDRGVGQTLNEAGDARPWRDADLETAFAEAGYDISRRSIQSWLSGRTIPTVKNLQALARVISGGDDGLRLQWAEMLITARQEIKQGEASSAAAGATRADIQAASTEDGSDVKSLSRESYGSRRPLLGVLGAALTVFALIAVFASDGRGAPMARDLRICDEARFSAADKTCRAHVAQFPSGVRLIYVSFKLTGMKAGQPFQRRWYRDGEEFLVRESFYDAAWTGWTYHWLDEGHADGRYALRIVVDGRVTTGAFVVGKDPHGVPDWIITRHEAGAEACGSPVSRNACTER